MKEIEYQYLRNWGLEDDPEVYKEINSLLPNSMGVVPMYGVDPRVMLVEFEE